MSDQTDYEKRIAKLNDMRAVLDFIEANPDIPAPYLGRVDAFPFDGSDIKKVTKAMSPCDKKNDSSFFILRRKFGSITLDINFLRKEVCERVVVGVKTIPKEIIEAKTIEAHTEEIVEWVCPDSIMRIGAENPADTIDEDFEALVEDSIIDETDNAASV